MIWVELFDEIKFLGFLFAVFNLLESGCAQPEVPLFIDSKDALGKT